VSQPAARTTGRLTGALLALLLVAGLAPSAALAVAPTDAPTLVSPTPGATVNANPILDWEPVSGATKYRVQVSASDTFSPLLYNVDTYNTSATPPTDLPLGALYWRVAGTDGGSGIGPYSDSNFTKEWGVAPNPIAPADATTLDYPGEPPLFTWEPLFGAVSYEIEIDDASDFVGAPRYSTANTSYTLTDQQAPGQTWYWHVRGKSGTSGVVSEWSATRFYNVAWPEVPTLTSPDNGATIEQVVLDWDPVAGAAKYQIQVSPNEDFSNNVVVDSIVWGTRYSPPTGLNNGAYFWHVRARDKESGSANNGGWSETRVFTRGWPDRPTQTWPLNGATVDEPTFRWTPVDHAAYYELQVANDVNFTVNADSCYTNHTEWTPYSRITGTGEPAGCDMPGFDPGFTYYWRVRGIDSPAKAGSGLALGLWSSTGPGDTFSFVYNPGLPIPLTPSEGQAVETPVLSWSHVPGAGRYHVTIFKSNGAVAVNAFTYAESYTPYNLAVADSPFSWHVAAVDAAGFEGILPGSDRSFILSPPTRTADLTLLTPADGGSSVRMPSMTWEPYVDDQGTIDPLDDVNADHYSVWYYQGGSASVELDGAPDLKLAGFTYGENELPLVGKQLGPGTYSWYVKAHSAGGAVMNISASQTFEILPYDKAEYTSPEKCVPTDTVCAKLPDTPSMDWEEVDWAGGYKVYVSQDADFTNEYRVYWTIHTSLTPRESYLDNQASQAYYWYVQPCTFGLIGPCGPKNAEDYPDAFAFQKRSAPIERTSPDPDATVTVANEVTFNWTDFLATNGTLTPPATQEARQYRIEVYTAADYSSGSRIDLQSVDQTTYTPWDRTYPEGPLYWRVQAIDGSQNFLTYSLVGSGSLTKSSPLVTLDLPSNGATVSGVPYFKWDPQTFAAKYELDLARNGDLLFSSGNRVSGYPVQTRLSAFAPTAALAAGVYAWRIRRLDADLRAGPWTAGRLFTLQGSAPDLVSPADDTVFSDNDLLFQWDAVAGVATYRLQVSTASNFSSIVESQDTVMTAWAPTRLYTDGTYYWRVQVRDSAGNILATSGSRSFVKDITRPTVISKTPTANASITGAFEATFSEPVSGVSDTSFKMVIAGTTTAVPGNVSAPSGTTARFVPSSPLVPGQSYTLSLTSGIVDVNGNTLVPHSWTVRTALTVENNSVAMRELWDRDGNASASGGAYDSSRTSAAKTTFTFNGTNVTVLGRRAPDGGYANIYLDGVKQVQGSFYASANQWKRTIWSKTGLAAAKHTVEVRVLNTKPAASSGTWVYVDAFKVGTVVYEETNAATKDQFRRQTHTSASGGSYDVTSHLASGDNSGKPTFQMTFKGTGIDWYATKTKASGKAVVYIDGVNKGTFDLYAGTAAYGVKVYGSPTLTNAVHTIKIVLTGAKQTAATGTDVSVDRLVVR
jgi:hypothetical protein